MPDTKISALAAAAALGGGEALPAVQAGATVRLTPTQLASYILASAPLTGAPTAPTATAGDSSGRVATTGFVASALAALVNAAPAALDTLKELADALGNDANFAATVTTALAGKQPASATLAALAGSPAAPASCPISPARAPWAPSPISSPTSPPPIPARRRTRRPAMRWDRRGSTARAGSAGCASTRAPARPCAGTLPDSVSLAYYEPARDYQAGLQRARRDGIGRRDDRIELAAAIPADAARGLAEDALARAWLERERATARVSWRLLGARAGTLATLDGDGPWRIAGWTLERMALELTLVRAGAPAQPLAGADAGRATTGPDAPAGATTLALLDLPSLDDAPATAPRIWLAAAGTGMGWRRASVSLSLDGGASWQAAGQTALPAIMGSTRTALADGPATLFDRATMVEVELLHDGMALQGADDIALVNGANQALIGDELVQFGTAQQLSATRWRLGRLLRGRRGSEWASATHVAGERFVLIEAASLLALDVPLAALGTTLAVSALGPGDAGAAADASLFVVGNAVRPPAPVHLRATRRADGTIDIAWTRRSRLGWAWLDGGDAPLGEDGERYRLQLTPTSGGGRTVEPAAPAYSYAPADQASDGAAGAVGLSVSLVQLGTSATSRPASNASWIW